MAKNKLLVSAAKCLQTRCFVTTSANMQIQQVQKCPVTTVAGTKLEDLASLRLKDYKEMPGPNPIPLLGNSWRFLPGIGEYTIGEFGTLCKQLHEQYGDIVRVEKILAMPDAVYAYDPHDIEKIYKTEGPFPERAISTVVEYYRKKYRSDVYRDHAGIANTNGPKWQKLRTKVNPVMMQPRIVKLYVTQVEEIAKDFVNRLKRIRLEDNKLPGDFLRESNRWTLESISCVALDTRLNCFDDNAPQKTLDLIDVTTEIFHLIFDLNFKSTMWKYVSTPKYLKVKRALDIQFNHSMEYLDEAVKRLEKKKATEVNTNREPSVLEKLLSIDRGTATAMVMDMLLNGVQTTANALASNLYHLAINKDKQDKLREEIMTVLPDDDSKLTEKNLDKLPYLKACFKEAARMYPIAPAGLRFLTSDTELSGYMLPKGIAVIFPMMYISRLEKNFPRANEYIPERWLRDSNNSELSYKNSHPFTTLPFGFGARSCIGRRVAELELEVAIVHLIRNFNVSWDGPPPKILTAGVNYLSGFHFIFDDAQIKKTEII